MALTRIRQEDEEEEARRRRRYPKPAPAIPALAIGPGHQGGREGGGGRRYFECRCLDDSIIVLEEGEKCPPGCNAITQNGGSPIVPVLITVGFFGLLVFAIVKRPFG